MRYPGRTSQHHRLGLAVATAINGSAYRRAAELAGTSQTVAETNIEASWLVPISPWLTLQPDIQYIIDPNTEPTLRNDLVAGLRLQISWDSRPGS